MIIPYGVKNRDTANPTAELKQGLFKRSGDSSSNTLIALVFTGGFLILMGLVAYYYVAKFRKKKLEETKEAELELKSAPLIVAVNATGNERQPDDKGSEKPPTMVDEIQIAKPVDPNQYMETVVRNFKNTQKDLDSADPNASKSTIYVPEKRDAISNILDGYEASSATTTNVSKDEDNANLTVEADSHDSSGKCTEPIEVTGVEIVTIKNEPVNDKTITRKAVSKESGFILNDANKASREAVNALISALAPPAVPPARISTDFPAPKDSIKRMTSISDMSTTSSHSLDSPKSRIRRYSINQFDSKKPILSYTNPKKKIDLSPSIKDDDEESILSYIPHMDGFTASPKPPSSTNFMNSLTRKLSTDGPSLTFDEMLEEIIEAEKAISIKSKSSHHE
ncbi:hypothetical protein HDV01_003018 [Terramyces sp. JEL0728]|nr:hypothetical protein HDV01_003018 [Terramyces sp. JEL0728]